MPTEPQALRAPLPDFKTPNPVNLFYTEIVDRDTEGYQAVAPVKRGTLYGTLTNTDQRIIDAYPNLYFCREIRIPRSDNLLIWMWATSPEAESSYNATVNYSGDAVANPVYGRVYTIRRDEYDDNEVIALGNSLNAIIGVHIAAGGTEYTSAQGTVGTNGLVQFVIVNGSIVSGVVTSEGDEITDGESISIAGDGTGAIATAIAQPVTAILTSQKKEEFPPDDPLALEFVRVTRVYEVLPGPYLPFTRYDDTLGPIQGQRRAVVNTGQVPTRTATTKTNYEARDGSSYVSWEIEETNSDGTGSGDGNPAFPIRIRDYYDDRRGAVQERRQIVVATGSEVGSLAVISTVVTKISYEIYAPNAFLLDKVTETWAVTGPLLAGQEYIRSLNVQIPRTEQLVAVGVGSGDETTDVEPINIAQEKDTVYDFSGIDPDYLVQVPDVVTVESLNLPRVLQSLTAIYTKSFGDDVSGTNSAYLDLTGPHGAGTLPANASVSNGASVSADLIPVVKEYTGYNVATIRYVIFMVQPFTTTDILVKLTRLVVTGTTVTITIASPGVVSWTAHGLNNGDRVTFTTSGTLPTGLSTNVIYYVVNKGTNDFQVSLTSGGSAINTSGSQSGVHKGRASVNNWPAFRPAPVDLLLTSRGVELQTNASVSGHYSYDEYGSIGVGANESTGISHKVTQSTQPLHIAPTIHGALSWSASDSRDATARAHVSLAGSGGFPSPDADTGSVTDTASAAISAASVSATSGASSVPTYGLYMVGHPTAEIFGDGAFIHIELVDMANVG